MKNPIALIFVVSVFLVGCHDSDYDPKATLPRDPLANFLVEAELTNRQASVDNISSEFGLEFVPTVDGTIINFVVQFPAQQTDLKVTLWDAEEQTVLLTEIFFTIAANTETFIGLDPIPILKGKHYMITANSEDWFEYTKDNAEAIAFPITVDKISFTRYGYHLGTEQFFPTEFEMNYYAGNVSFTFRPAK